uniref:Uncharacterized protein n=1 Tax=Cacopsylla melanoneura TaxID=428564 RepID=A0A8D8Q5M3_9HEMI
MQKIQANIEDSKDMQENQKLENTNLEGKEIWVGKKELSKNQETLKTRDSIKPNLVSVVTTKNCNYCTSVEQSADANQGKPLEKMTRNKIFGNNQYLSSTKCMAKSCESNDTIDDDRIENIVESEPINNESPNKTYERQPTKNTKQIIVITKPNVKTTISEINDETMYSDLTHNVGYSDKHADSKSNQKSDSATTKSINSECEDCKNTSRKCPNNKSTIHFVIEEPQDKDNDVLRTKVQTTKPLCPCLKKTNKVSMMKTKKLTFAKNDTLCAANDIHIDSSDELPE